MTVNYFTMLVAALQVVAGAWAFWTNDWKLGVINACVGVANAVLATMAKAG